MTTATDAPSCSLCARLIVGEYEWGHGVGCWRYAWCKGHRRGPNHTSGRTHFLVGRGPGGYYKAKDGARQLAAEARVLAGR
jgi:hypothetical protein